MQTKLTEVAVARLAPDPKQRREVIDTVIPGLVMRVTPQGSKSWSLLYRVAGEGEGGKRGKLRRMGLGAYPLVDLKTARERAREAIDKADRGIDPAAQRTIEVTTRVQKSFETVCGRFIELYARPNTKCWDATERLLNANAVSRWKGRAIDEISRHEAHALLDEVSQDHGMARAREVRKHLSKLFNWAVDRGMMPASPFAGMRRPEMRYVPRARVLSMEELDAIWDAADRTGHPYGDMVKLLILTVQRRSEIAEARRSWILDGQDALEIPAVDYKTGRIQVVPLSPQAMKIVEGLPKWNAGDCLFSSTAGKLPINGFSQYKAKFDKLCRVEGWTLHDLRRSGATHMARMGVPADHVERVLGHVLGGVAGVYNTWDYIPEKRAALEKWGSLWN